MSTGDNKAVVRRYDEEVWGKVDLAAERELVASDFVDHNPLPGQAPGLEGHHQKLTVFRNAFPDFELTAEDLIAEGDKVARRFTARLTHQGEFLGIPATGKQATVTGISIFRIAGGKIAEYWHELDSLGMMQQLGVVPTPG